MCRYSEKTLSVQIFSLTFSPSTSRYLLQSWPRVRQRRPESLFQTPTPLIFQNFWNRMRVQKFFKFHHPTPVQTLATNRSYRNLRMFFLKRWPSRLLLLPKLKSESGSASERNLVSCRSRLRHSGSRATSGVRAVPYYVGVPLFCNFYDQTLSSSFHQLRTVIKFR